jgi:hypothetical protein
MDDATQVPFIDQVKLQARVLVPLIKAFEEELGAEHARAIAKRALAEWTKKQYAKIREGFPGNPMDLLAAGMPTFARENALQYDVVQRTPSGFDFNVTRCAYAEFYKALGEPDLGFLFVCELDESMAEGLGEDVEFRRTQTIMQGAEFCDFRYRLRGE